MIEARPAQVAVVRLVLGLLRLGLGLRLVDHDRVRTRRRQVHAVVGEQHHLVLARLGRSSERPGAPAPVRREAPGILGQRRPTELRRRIDRDLELLGGIVGELHRDLDALPRPERDLLERFVRKQKDRAFLVVAGSTILRVVALGSSDDARRARRPLGRVACQSCQRHDNRDTRSGSGHTHPRHPIASVTSTPRGSLTWEPFAHSEHKAAG